MKKKKTIKLKESLISKIKKKDSILNDLLIAKIFKIFTQKI